MSLYANRIYHRDRFESFERLAVAELEAMTAGDACAHVLTYYQRRGAVHFCVWRDLVLADAVRVAA